MKLASHGVDQYNPPEPGDNVIPSSARQIA